MQINSPKGNNDWARGGGLSISLSSLISNLQNFFDAQLISRASDFEVSNPEKHALASEIINYYQILGGEP